MKDDCVVIVLTENRMLHAGIYSIFPERKCIHLGYDYETLPVIIKDSQKAIVIIDSLIYFKGIWSTFNAVMDSSAIISIIWLTSGDVGRVFPIYKNSDYVVDSKIDVLSFQQMFENGKECCLVNKKISMANPIYLTSKEKRLLILFITIEDIKLISKISGLTMKNLYNHRCNIMKKMGFKQFCHLVFTYKKNTSLFTLEIMKRVDNNG